MRSYLTGHTITGRKLDLAQGKSFVNPCSIPYHLLRSEALHCLCFKHSFTKLEKTIEKENGTGSFLDPKWLRVLLPHNALKLYSSNTWSFKCLVPI